MHRNCPYHLGA